MYNIHVHGLGYIGSVAAATIHDDFFSSIVKEDFQEGFKAGVGRVISHSMIQE